MRQDSGEFIFEQDCHGTRYRTR